MENLIKKIMEVTDVQEKNSCIRCDERKKVALNFFSVLQDVLEENGIDVERFAKISKLFEVSNGRLRLDEKSDCFSITSIEEILAKM